MSNLIDSILIGSFATYLPFWIWRDSTQHFLSAIVFSLVIYLAKVWRAWKEEMFEK